jgi:hypothetical protein
MTILRRASRFCALVVATLVAGQARAIVGESAPAPDLAPYTVMVLKRGVDSAGFCSGAVVARDVVLTAAHCVAGVAHTRAHFRGRDGAPVLLDVAAIATHPEFRADAVKARARSIDLALVRLARPLPEPFAVVNLAEDRAGVGESVRLAGFGVTRAGAPQSGGALRAAALNVRAPASAILMWAEGRNGRVGACTGDSGAPVFDGGRNLTAIVAWASRDCGTLTQGAWIAPQRGWIDKTLAGWGHR